MRRAATYRPDWPNVIAGFYPGERNPLPRLGERIEVHNFMTGETRFGIVVGRDAGTHTYDVAVGVVQLRMGIGT